MKKKFLLSILGIAAVSSFGQGVIRLDNYFTDGPIVTYGLPWPLGPGLNSAYTMGMYYWNALGNFTDLTSFDGSGFADPTALGSYLLATGAGSTAQFQTTTFGLPGEAVASSPWSIPIAPGPTGGATITLIVVAYAGPSYASALYRGHSAPFTLVTSDATSPGPVTTGSAMPGFVVWIPEPSTLALAGLIGGAWLLFRRRRS